jgi:hypothetical protein
MNDVPLSRRNGSEKLEVVVKEELLPFWSVNEISVTVTKNCEYVSPSGWTGTTCNGPLEIYQ